MSSPTPLLDQGIGAACCVVKTLRWCVCVLVCIIAGLEFSGDSENAAGGELKEMLATSMRVREKSEADKMVLVVIGLMVLNGVGVGKLSWSVSL